MQLVIGAIGLGIGSMFGVPGIGWTIGSMLGSMLFGGGEDIYVKNETFGPRMKDLKVQTSMFGVPIPIAYGTNRLGGILIDADELKEHEHVEEETQTSTGGKGGSPSYTQTSTYTWYSYSCSFAVAFCKGPAETITRIWAGGDLIYDVTGNSDIVQIEGLNMRIYLGDESQEPDPTLESFHGAGEVPGYRGLVYIVFTDLDLTENFGNALPNITAEVVSTSWTNTYTAIDMDVPVTLDAGAFLLVDKWRPYAYHFHDGWIYKIDLIAGAVIASADIDHYNLGAHLPCLDAAGRIYYPCRPGGAGSWYVRRCDPDTLVWDGWVTATGFPYGIQDTACWGNVLYVSSYVVGDIKAYSTEDGSQLWARSGSSAYTQLVPISEVELWAIRSSGIAKIMNGQLDQWYDVSSSIASANNMFYLQRENVMIVGSNTANKLAKFDIYTGAITDTLSGVCGSFMHAAFKHASMNQATIVGDIPGDVDLSFFADQFPALLYLPVGGTCREIDLISFEVRKSWAAELFGIDNWLGGVYDWRTHSVLTNDLSDIWQCYLDRGTGGGEELDNIVSDLITNHESWMTEEQLTTDDIDVTDLESDTVHGYAITSQMSRRQAIEPLMLAYQFDACLEDSKIKFVKRGAANVATITEDDLGAYEAGGDPSEPLQTQQDHELELPCQVSVTYSNPSRDYEQGTQYSRRLLTTSQKTLTINLNIALSNNEAYRIAEKILAIAWTERYKYTLTTSREYLHLSPTDVIYVERDGDYYRMRIEKTSYGAPGLIPMECVEDCALDVDSDQEGAADDPYTSPVIPYYGPTRLYLLDIPLLREVDNNAGFYLAASGYTNGWVGAAVWRSSDDGATYQGFTALPTGVVCGIATTALDDGPYTVWDDGNTVDIIVFNSETLSSDTEAHVLSGANAALLGDEGSWEIIQWKTATLVDAASNKYRLSNLVRGRRGTEWAVTEHAVGDKFIQLQNNGSIRRKNPGTDDIGVEHHYKAISNGTLSENTSSVAWTNDAIGLKPYAPCNAAATRDGDYDVTITWIRRGRYGGEWRDYVDVPLGEDSEEYEVDVMDGETVVRTIKSLTSEEATYTAAQQATDFGGICEEIEVNIYQLSETVGRGYPLNATFSFQTGWDGSPHKVGITIPSTSVGEVLTDFPIYVDLSDLPDLFWVNLSFNDGREIRVKDDGGSDIPFDLVYCDRSTKTGSLFAKHTLSNVADTTIYIYYGYPDNDFVGPAETNGRNNVWSDYHRVYLFTGKDAYEDRSGNGAAPVSGGMLGAFYPTALSGDVYSHQGVAYDGTYYYCVDTNYIRKYDSDWNLIASNSNPCGNIGGGVDHCGDPDIYDGILYVPAETYVSISNYSNMKIAKFSAVDLSYISSTDISAQAHEISSLCYCSEDGLLYAISYADGSKFWKYNPSDLSYVEYLSLSSTPTYLQGITYWQDRFWVNSDIPSGIKSTYAVDYDGTVGPTVSYTPSAGTTHSWEGLSHTDDNLLSIYSSGAGQGVIYTLENVSVEANVGVRFSGANTTPKNYLRAAVSEYTSWTIGASCKISSKSINRVIASYAVTGTDDTKRATLAYRNSTDQFGLWNTTDGWLFSAASPAVDTLYRFHAVHNSTTERKIYTNGSAVTDSGCTAYGVAGTDALYIGAEDASLAEYMNGYIGFVYLRAAVLSANWISAEVTNLHDTASFYTVGSQEAVS